jgi:hypothetical protein
LWEDKFTGRNLEDAIGAGPEGLSALWSEFKKCQSAMTTGIGTSEHTPKTSSGAANNTTPTGAMDKLKKTNAAPRDGTRGATKAKGKGKATILTKEGNLNNDAESNTNSNTERNTECNANSDTKSHADLDVERNVEHDTERDAEHHAECDAEPDAERVPSISGGIGESSVQTSRDAERTPKGGQGEPATHKSGLRKRTRENADAVAAAKLLRTDEEAMKYATSSYQTVTEALNILEMLSKQEKDAILRKRMGSVMNLLRQAD